MPLQRFPPPTPVSRRQQDTRGPKYCRGCGYQLDGLTTPRCPECGVPFNPNDSSTYVHEPVETTARTAASVAIGLVVVAIIAAVSFLIIFILTAALHGP